MNRPKHEQKTKDLVIEQINARFSVCKLNDFFGIDLHRPFVFTATTDQELSLVCPTELVPDNATDREDGWLAFRIAGMLDFSLIGILAQISKTLASADIGIFAISTFNTDYILVKEENYVKALSAMKNEGYQLMYALPS